VQPDLSNANCPAISHIHDKLTPHYKK